MKPYTFQSRLAQPWIWSLLAIGLMSLPARASILENIGSVTATHGEGGYASAIIDTDNNFVNFGSSNPVFFNYGYLSQFQTAPTFAYSAGVLGFFQMINYTAGIYDPGTGYSYWASSGTFFGDPAHLLRVHLNSPVTLSSTTFLFGQNDIRTAVIDTDNHIGYFGTFTSPSIVIKVDLTNFVLVSSLTLPAGVAYLDASFIDTTAGYAYFGSSTTTGGVAKIKLSDFSLAATLSFNSGEGGAASAIFDPIHHYAYFGTHDVPGKVIQIRLSDFTRTAGITLNSGEDDLTSAAIDLNRTYGFFGTNTAPGKVVTVILTTMHETSTLQLDTGENYLRSVAFDAANSYAYFGTYTTPGQVVKVDVLSGPPDIQLQPGNVNLHAGERATFAVAATGRNITYQWQRNGTDISGATAASYSFATTAADDGSNFLCVLTNDKGTVLTQSAQLTILPIIRAYPNPWRSDRHTSTPLTIDGLLSNSTVKIFTLSAHWVKTFPPASGSVTWDLTNDSGEKVASGYYLYVVTARSDKQTTHGKLMVIR